MEMAGRFFWRNHRFRHFGDNILGTENRRKSMEAADIKAVVTQAPVSGSDPEIKVSDVLDVALAASSQADKDVKEKDTKPSDGAEEDLPWGKDPRFKEVLKDKGLLRSVKNVMEANDLTFDDLADLVAKGKAVKGKNIDIDKIDEVLEDSALLKKYRAYWAQQEEVKRRQEEDPDQTIQRYEQKIKELEGKERAKADKEKAAKEAQESVRFYERTVSELLEDAEDFPKEQHKFISLVMGVSNPTNDIDITDRKAIKKTYNSILKEVKAFADAMKQAGAAEYRKGKLEIPKVASSTPAAPVTEVKHNLKTARTALREVFMGKSG
jgi:hypothetical protein